MSKVEIVLQKIKNNKKEWNEEPVFCFTSDIDWASEAVLNEYFNEILPFEIIPTLFVTHKSELIEKQFQSGYIERGIHPNFLPQSSHGKNFQEIIEKCISFAPESKGFRSHRLFDVTDVTHLLKNKYQFNYVSNLGTVFQEYVTPILHESGLIHYPIFFEDGTHLYNQMDLNIMKYESYFSSPGIKIISFHPMNFIFNSPSISYMRNIKDSLNRDEYSNINKDLINDLRNKSKGIGDTVKDLLEYVISKGYKIMTMNEIYKETIK